MYTEAEGGQSLEVQWRGPGVKKQVIPAERAIATTAALVPPRTRAAPDSDSVQRGRLRASERRCDACHAFEDSLFAQAPPPAAAAFATLGERPCPQQGGAAAIVTAASASLQRSHGPRDELAAAMLRDGCLSCHVRDARGGLPPAVRQQLVEVEDLGDEGRLPPDLTNVGRRLRQAWIEKVVGSGHSVRPYLRVRMPPLPEPRAKAYAAWFAAVDAAGVKDDEPPFSVEAVQAGRRLAGTTGRNCVTCHPFDGRKALGPQGMDLVVQHERLRPAWFREWLLHAATLRPGTRMPTLWWRGDDADRREVDALRTWLSLGAAAPLPDGLVTNPGEFALEPEQRPRLHGAFLKGLSARCLAVGTPERTHYAYDLAHARLAWLWRGAFLDAEGTWKGRAGKLLVPKGQDWVVLDDLEIAGGAPRRMLGQRVTSDGYPVFRVAAGEVEFEDEMRPRLVEGGSEIVRTLRCTRGVLEIVLPPPSGTVQLTVAGAKGGRQRCETGQTLEVVYRW
jgi:mono/diheme cytochrome c family protein